MAAVHHVEDERAAIALADHLNGNLRRRPVVVVTIPGGRDEPWIKVDEIAQEAGNLADVYLMRTGPFTWEFSHRMPGGTQVYGGAGRVYPVGHEWISHLGRSPLRFAFDADDGARATAQLISDLLRMAAASGIVQAQPVKQLRRVTGVVRKTIAGRALVDVGNLMPAVVAEELTVEGVAIDRVLTVGQRVQGSYDPQTNRVDVTPNLRLPTDALSSYAVGDVVLAKVAMVRNGKAELSLYPRTPAGPGILVPVLRADVTGNPADDLRTLMTVGEVVEARLNAVGPAWALTLLDIDDDEPVTPAPALLPGGPPWLSDDEPEPAVEKAPPLPQPAAPPLAVLLAPPTAPEPAPAPAVPAPAAVRPTPALLAKGHGAAPPSTVPEPAQSTAPEPAPARPVPKPGPKPGPRVSGVKPAPAPAPAASAPSAGPTPTPPAGTAAVGPSTRALLLQIDGLKAEVRRLERTVEDHAVQLAAATDTGQQLRYLLDQEQRRANKAETDLRNTRSRLRKASSARRSDVAAEGPHFADREQGFRHLVTTTWATRLGQAEQRERPLPEFAIGRRFLDSLDRLEGITATKVADVVFEVVTGLAIDLPGRDVHRLRTGMGGDAPPRTREDGATCMRANLQSNTPSARRLHYWKLPTGQVELSRVVTHDDFEP